MTTALTVYPVDTNSGVLTSAGLLVNSTGGATGGAHGTLIGTSTGWGEITWAGTSAAWPGLLSTIPTGRGALLDGSLLFGQQIITGNWSATLKFLASTTGTTFNGTVLLRFYKYNSDTGVYTNIGTIQVSGQSITNSGTVVSFPATLAPAMSFNNNEYLYTDTWFNCTSSSGATSASKIKISTAVSTSQGNAGFQVATPGYQVAPAKTTGLRTPIRTKVTKSLGLRILARTRNTRSAALRVAARTQKTTLAALRAVVGGRARWASLRAIVRTRTSVWTGVRTLVAVGGAQVTRALGLRTLVATNVPLTLYGTNTAAHTVSTANTMIANVTGAAPSATTTLIGTATGWGEVYAQGSGSSWPALGAIGAPSDQGWLYDSITLEGWQIPFGNWVTTLRLYVSVGSITADIAVGAWKRAADGTYTQIGSTMVLAGQSITTTVARYDLPSVAQPGTAFGVGDKLYLGIWLNITTSNTGWSLATLSCNASNSAGVGAANNLVVITPGIQALGSPVTRGANLRALVRSAQFGASLLRIHARTKATRSSALRLVTQARIVSRALSLRVRTTVPPHTMGAGIRVVTLDPPSASNTWYSTTAIGQGPLVYYRMGETAGTTAAFDATGNGQQGVITGGVTPGQMGLLAGDNDGAMSFDGLSGAITATLDPTLPGMPQGAGAWSMAAWIQLSAYPTRLACVMDFATSATDPNQALSFDSSVLPLNSPCFLLATYDGQVLTLSIGVGGAVGVVGSVPMTCSLVGTQLGVGSRADGSAHLAAIIDEPALFPYALTPSQGQTLYQAGITVPPTQASSAPSGFATSLQSASGTVPSNNPLGQTMNIPNNHPGMPDQAIIDMVGGTGRGGTTPGWGAGASIRYQQHWGQATEPSADHVYDWSAVDSTVDRCTAAGVSVLWVLSYPPTQYLTVRASDGVDTGSPGAEYANAATWTYFCRQVAARYNGTSINALTGRAQTPRLIPELSIFNEEYDEGDHLPRDDQSKWLVPVVQQAAPAIMALHPSVILGVGAVRHTYNNSRGHIAAWLTNLFTYTPPGSHMAGIGNLVRWISFHYYRGGSGDNFPNPDPTSSSADMPSIGQQIDLMFATVRPLGFTGGIYCNEFGWACYDGEKGVVTVSPDVQSQYLLDVIDACRTHGVAKIHIFTLNPGSHVNLANNPPTADAVRSIVQTINNVYTYLPAYQMMVRYHHDFPVWNKSVTPKTLDGMGRFTLVVQSTVSRANPYGVTLYVDPKANPLHIPAQLLIDLAGGSGGSPAGWGKNPCLRWQLHWTDVEPNADEIYDWSRVDNAIDDCLAAGVYLMWPIEYAPGGYLTIRASDGATVAAGTGDLASPAAWKTFMRAVAARYNGTTKNAITGAAQVARILPEAQIGNEEYDQFTPYDFQGSLLGDVAKVAIPAYKAIHPTGRVSLGSVRKKTNDAVAHFGNWIDGLYTHMGGDLADAVTIHYYRGGTFNPDPTTSNHADTPSIAECLAALLAGVARNGGTAEVYIDEYGWDVYDDGSGTTPVVTLAQQSQFIRDVLDAWRTGGGARANLFWIQPGATVNLTKTPPTSTAIKSITQHISGVYTYLPAYTMIAAYAKTYPYWGTATIPKTMDGMGRFTLVAPGGGVTPLTLYATTVPAAEGATAGTLAVVEGGTQVTMSTLVGTAKGYGELPALGSTLAWPARTGFQAPDGRGWYLDGTILDSQIVAAGAWSGVVRIGPPAGTGMVGDIWVRLFRFTPVAGTYTHIGDLQVTGVALVGLLNATLAANTFASVTFLPDDRLYVELWLDITTPASVAGTLMHVVETSTAGTGHANNLQIFTPGYSSVTVPIPVTMNGMGRFSLTAPHRTRDGMGRFVLAAPGQVCMDGMGRFVLRAPSGLAVAIGGNPAVPFKEDTWLLSPKLDERWRAQLTVLDYAGNQAYSYGEQVVVNDGALGPLFSGFVGDDTQDKTNTYPDPTIEHKIDCIDNRHRADKRTSNRLYTTPTPAGKIVVDMLADVLTAEGVQASYAIREDTSVVDWNAGTLVNTQGVPGTTGGALSLAPAGSPVTKIEQVASDWLAGTMAGTMVNGDLLQLAAHPALSFSGVCSSGYGNAYAYYKIWAGAYIIQNGDTLTYQVWIHSASPEIKAGIDGICTDGTSIRDYNRLGGGASGPPDGFIFDQNGIRAHPNSDLSGVANDQWYARRIDLSVLVGKTLAHIDLSFEGGNAGTYQAYFYDIWMQNAAGAITQNFYGNRGVVSPLLSFPNLSSKVSNIGYSNIQIRAVTAYEGTGTRLSANIPCGVAGICQSSQIDWLASTPGGSGLVVSTSVDTGATFQQAAPLTAIANLLPGASLAGHTITTKISMTITGKDPTVTPTVARFFWQVMPSYATTKQDTFKTFTSRADWLSGTFVETAAPGGDLRINSVLRDWNNQQTTGQTFFGGPGRQSIWRNAGALRANGAPPPGTVSRSRLDFAGAWQNFIMSIDVSVPTTSVFAGIEYRTTYWDNNPNTGGYLVDLTPTSLNFGRGTNSAGGIHTTIQTKVLSPPMTVADWHTITIVALGNQHTVYLDGVAFWGTVTDTTANLQGAGFFALRVYNNTIGDQTCYFDNFGVMPIDAIYPGPGPLFSGPTWTSPVTPLGNFTGGSSLLFWDATTALGDYLNVLTNFNGTGYQVATSGAAIPGIMQGTAYTNATLQILVQMQAATPADTPVIHGLTAWVSSQYTATGTRVSPALSLTPVGRLGSSMVAWNAVTPTNTSLMVEVGNSATWTDVTGNNGGTIPGYQVQPDPTIDTFGVNTSASYTSTSLGGGTPAPWVWDTANRRLTVSGGSNAVLLYESLTARDVDALFDTDTSDTLGLVWRYIDTNNCYYLEVHDAGASNPSVIQVWKRASGTSTQLGKSKTITFTRGMQKRFRLTMMGGQVRVGMNGTTLFTFTDATPLGPGQVGLRTNGGRGTIYQLRIQPLGDDVTGSLTSTRLTLTTTDPGVSSQVQDLVVAAYDPNIGPGSIIPSADYRNTFVDKNLDDLAKQSNYGWWFDASVQIHFNSRVALPAPWILSSNKLALPSDLEVDTNLAVEVLGDVYRNRQKLTGVTNTSLFQQSFVGDGKTTSFTLSYPLATGTTPVITLNGNGQSVGQKGTSGAQWYFAPGDPVVAQDSGGTILEDFDTLTISYTGTFTDTVVVDDVQAQAALQALSGGTGIVESVIDVSSPGMLYPAAVVYANQLLERYCITDESSRPTGRTITFKTYWNGLEIGQMLAVFIPEENIWNGQFLITGIDISMQSQPRGAVLYGYLVTATELPNIGSWSKLLASGLLQRL